MAAAWWWLSLPGWLGSGAAWFVVLNAVVAAVAVLSRTRPPLASPRRGSGGATRGASSAVLQRLRSSSIFSLPSACFSNSAPFLQLDATAQEAEQPEPEPVRAATPTPTTTKISRRALPLPASPAAERSLALPKSSAVERPPAAEEEDDDPSVLSMEDAYALALAARRRPEPEREEEARRSEVDAKAEEFIRGFNEDQRQERLNSIFNYTQMLKQRALDAGQRQPAGQSDQP